jgi:molybdopterin-binding protein
MQLSARNQIKGTVKQMRHGEVETEVVVEIAPGLEIASIITRTSAERMQLKAGAGVYAIIKASNVILGVD